MRGIICSLAISAALGVTGTAVAAPANPFAGPWSGRCGDDVQCKVEFVTVGKTYQMTLRVSDAQNYDEVVCIIEADLTAFAPDVLVSGDRSTRAMRAKTGELIISGLPNDECSGAVINGAYVEYADK